MSQFDSLLDFGESTPAETNGTTQEDKAVDDFDPFGPSPTIEAKGNVDGNLLVDFNADTEISNGTKQNGASEPFELSFEVSTDNDQQTVENTENTTNAAVDSNMSSNPLYDFETSDEPASNPLYEFETQTTETTVIKSSSSQEFKDSGPSNPLYEFENNGDVQVETSGSSNPLYDFMSNGNSGFGDEFVTETTTTQKLSGDDDFLIETVTTNESSSNNAGQDQLITVNTQGGNLMDDFETQEEQAYEEMKPANYQVDNLLGDYENTQIVSDVIQPEESLLVESARSPSPEPVREQSPEPIREPTPEPVREPTPEPFREPTPEPVREPSPEPIREPTPEPVREPTPEPVREPTPEPVREQTPEPVREPTPEPVREPTPEPVQKVTYSSTSFISLTPTSPNAPEFSSRSSIQLSQSSNTFEDETKQDGQVINRGKQENRYSDSFGDTTDSRPVNVQSMGGTAQQNGYDREEVSFTEMSSVRNAFESGGPQQQTTNQTASQDINWDEEEEGVYENEPVQLSNVARESDRNIGAELPEVGMAKNLRNRFASVENEEKSYKREVTPPRQAAGKVEFESEPAPHIQVFEQKAEAGIFESQPQVNEDVVHSGEVVNEPLPERGTAKNLASKFRELEKTGGSYTPSPKREITPDRSGRVEFVSEPKTTVEKYEGKADAGIFESQPQNYEGVVRSEESVEEILPERGSAKNMAQRFKEMESSQSSSSPKNKREITPDRFTKGEYTSEPRANHLEIYEQKADAGVFENRPDDRADVVKSDQYMEETLPERGFAKNVAAKFKELESNTKSPPPTPGSRKEFTPPREAGVYESQPQQSPDVVSEQQPKEEIIPEKGYAKNLVSRFKQIEQENSKIQSSSRKGREITPPKGETGVFENEPKQFVPEYNQKIDTGISENKPQVREDVFKESDPAKYEEELPERGTAKNLVSRWKQMESQSGSRSPHSQGRTKEFTPPREEERIKSMRSPMMSPGANQFESVQPGDLPGQYQQSSEPVVFESQPENRADVFREADTDWTEGMPKENAAKKMVAKFKHIQAEATKESPKPVSRKEDGDTRQSPESEVTQQEAATPKKKGGFFIPSTPADKCGACQKTVYAMEKFEMNKVIYHKNCFRCSHCKSKLTPKTFAANNGVIFCTNHLMQLFKSKGNYDEGFGREQHKKKWAADGVANDENEES